MKKYYPILIAKKGEIIALQYLTQSTKDNICPIIEVVNETLEKKVKVDSENNSPRKSVYKEDLEIFLKTHWSFLGNQIILDFSLVTDIEQKMPLVEGMIKSLLNFGVNVILAIQVNSNNLYLDFAKKLFLESNIDLCLRTSENSGGFDYFNIAIDRLLLNGDIEVNRVILLLDLGYAKLDRYNSLRDLAKEKLRSLPKSILEWKSVVVASSSFPENLGEFKIDIVPNRITRFEWSIWKNLIEEPDFNGIKYGDFGTRSPIYSETNFAGTISVKYTTENEFVIYKGEKTEDHKDGHGQYISHAQKLIKSDDYCGKDFSWGDMRIQDISNQEIENQKRKTGSTTTWVQISQNHHITLLENLL